MVSLLLFERFVVEFTILYIKGMFNRLDIKILIFTQNIFDIFLRRVVFKVIWDKFLRRFTLKESFLLRHLNLHSFHELRLSLGAVVVKNLLRALGFHQRGQFFRPWTQWANWTNFLDKQFGFDFIFVKVFLLLWGNLGFFSLKRILPIQFAIERRISHWKGGYSRSMWKKRILNR